MSILQKLFSTFFCTLNPSLIRAGNRGCLKILQVSSKFQSAYATLEKDWNISDDLLIKLEEFVHKNVSFVSTICEKNIWMKLDLARGRIMLLVFGKVTWKQILNFEVYQTTDGAKVQTYAGMKNPSERYRRNVN